MRSLLVPSPLVLPSLPGKSLPKLHSQFQHIGPDSSHCDRYRGSPFCLLFQSSFSCKSLCNHRSLAGAANASNEGAVSVINIEDFYEKDWSFLDSGELSSEESKWNVDRITSAGDIEGTSRVLVSVGLKDLWII